MQDLDLPIAYLPRYLGSEQIKVPPRLYRPHQEDSANEHCQVEELYNQPPASSSASERSYLRTAGGSLPFIG